MPKVRSPLRNGAEELLFELALSSLSRLADGPAESFGAFAGRMFRRVSRRRREITDSNLRLAFPELSAEEIERLSLRVFEHFGRLAVDLLRTIDEPLSSILSRVEIEGAEVARSAVGSGRGVFFLTGHLGNWELGALVTATLGTPVSVVARPLDNPALDRRLQTFRERTGNRVLPKGDAARPILRTLRAGGAIGILADQHAHPPDAVVAPFFGRPASTTSAVARFADRVEALIVPVTMTAVPGRRRYVLRFDPPIDVRELPLEERTLERLTTRVNSALERCIRENPAQWLWLHDRWRVKR